MTETGSPQPADPRRSPSYPQRVHIRERAQWEAQLAAWDEKIRAYRQKYGTIGAHANRDGYALLLAQMDGARDQIAAAVRRLPMEVGGLYDEDRHLLVEAEKALGRVFKRWDTV